MTAPQRPGPAGVAPEQLISELLADYNALNDQAARTRASLTATAGTATGEAVRLVVSASGQLQQVGINAKGADKQYGDTDTGGNPADDIQRL